VGCSRVQQGFDGAPETQILARGLPLCRQQACARDIRVSPCASHHLGAVRRNPGIVGCPVNSATKFFGMSAFRLSTISSAAARFSEMRVLLFLYPSWDRAPLDMLGEPPVRRSVNVASRQRSDCLLGKGGLM